VAVTPDLLFDFTFDTDHAAHDVLNASAHILVVFILVLIAISLTNRLITPLVRVAIREQMSNEPEVEVKKRIDTLTQVISRTIVLVVFVLAFVTVLPEFGVNAGPLIAGLGLVGLAVGFGSQNLVKDVINGMFILVENQYAVGDVVRVAGVKGTVEAMTMRNTTLRDDDGTLHIVPNSEIKIVSNLTRDWAQVALHVSVAYNEDSDKVVKLLNDVAQEVRNDPGFSEDIVADPQVPGIERVAGGEVDYLMLVKTRPGRQYAVTRELRRRIKECFQKNNIQAGNPPACTCWRERPRRSSEFG